MSGIIKGERETAGSSLTPRTKLKSATLALSERLLRVVAQEIGFGFIRRPEFLTRFEHIFILGAWSTHISLCVVNSLD